MSDHDLRLHIADANELAELLAFLREWLNSSDNELAPAAASFARFVGNDAYNLDALRADLARFAFLLGADSEQLFGPDLP